MRFLRAILSPLLLRGITATAVGFGLVATLALGLFLLGGRGDPAAVSSTRLASTLSFPEDEQSLNRLTAQVMREAALTQHSAKIIPLPQDIQPAAGE